MDASPGRQFPMDALKSRPPPPHRKAAITSADFQHRPHEDGVSLRPIQAVTHHHSATRADYTRPIGPQHPVTVGLYTECHTGGGHQRGAVHAATRTTQRIICRPSGCGRKVPVFSISLWFLHVRTHWYTTPPAPSSRQHEKDEHTRDVSK